MFNVAFFVVALLGVASASPAANGYVESVIFGPLQSELRSLGLNPAAIPDFNAEWKDKVLIIGKVKGQANYTNGRLSGLASIARYGECYGPTYSFGSTVINCTIGFDHLSVSHKVKVKYGKMPAVPVSVTGNVTRTLLYVTFNASPTSAYAQVGRLDFQLVGQVNPKYSGLGQLSKFLKFLSDPYRSRISADIFSIITNNFRYALNRAASQIAMPR